MKPPFGIALLPASSLANHTGSWRTSRPTYVERAPPCARACPAGEDPRGWIALARAGDDRAAWEAIVQANPLPAVTGRACYHPCEASCLRGDVDDAISIRALERVVADTALREGWPLPAAGAATGKRVLVVGSGPAGLSAAYHLARGGHAVTVREAAPALGGMLRYGIPRYRLPREVLDAEIARIAALGVRFETGVRVADAASAAAAFDACFVAIGAQISHRIELTTDDAARVIDALALLGEAPPRIGRRVIVYGGGSTALDAARVAKRLGADDACIVYRRDREHMPAHACEVREAEEEGVHFRWLRTIDRVEAGKVVVERMVLGPDGRAQPTGELETLDAGTVVLAVGQDVDLSVVGGKAPTVDATMQTDRGFFAGGDLVSQDRTVAVAIGHGTRAAAAIEARLSGVPPLERPRAEPATFHRLNLAYVEPAAAATEPMLPPATRVTSFAEARGCLSPAAAQQEAERCLSCGLCFECDNCFALCPDAAIAKLGAGRGYEIDYEYCKGCGVCANECPCGAIAMIPEPS